MWIASDYISCGVKECPHVGRCLFFFKGEAYDAEIAINTIVATRVDSCPMLVTTIFLSTFPELEKRGETRW